MSWAGMDGFGGYGFHRDFDVAVKDLGLVQRPVVRQLYLLLKLRTCLAAKARWDVIQCRSKSWRHPSPSARAKCARANAHQAYGRRVEVLCCGLRGQQAGAAGSPRRGGILFDWGANLMRWSWASMVDRMVYNSIESKLSPSMPSIWRIHLPTSRSTRSSSSSCSSLMKGSISGSRLSHSSPSLPVRLISHCTAASLTAASSERICARIAAFSDL